MKLFNIVSQPAEPNIIFNSGQGFIGDLNIQLSAYQ